LVSPAPLARPSVARFACRKFSLSDIIFLAANHARSNFQHASETKQATRKIRHSINEPALYYEQVKIFNF
jgi:hypothetical protein